MTYRVQVQKAEHGYDAWLPGVEGCVADGMTEAEALQNLRHAIEGRLDLEKLDIRNGETVERYLTVETPEQRSARRREAESTAQPAPSPFPPYAQFIVGGTLFAMGLAGTLGYIFSAPRPSPAFMFLAVIVAAAGAGGILMGLLTHLSLKSAK